MSAQYEEIRRTVKASGLWNNGGEERYGFRLSPEVFPLDSTQKEHLDELGFALRDCLAGISRLAAIASQDDLAGTPSLKELGRLFTAGVPKTYRPLMKERVADSPSFCKVDLMVDRDGNLYIAEIDTCNQRGLGWAILCARLRETACEHPGLPGIGPYLKQETVRLARKLGLPPRIALLCANQERFYRPGFDILQAELAVHGVELEIIPEEEAVVSPDGLSGTAGVPHRLVVSWPFLYRNQEVNRRLALQYREGKIHFLIPPKPFLGSKAVMALLSNPLRTGRYDDWECLLRSQIEQSSLNTVRRFLPATLILDGKENPRYFRTDRSNSARPNPPVAKEVVSSGMKGVHFPGQPGYEKVIDLGMNAPMTVVLQEMVRSWPRQLSWYRTPEELVSSDCHLRLIAHFGFNRAPYEGSLLEIDVTALESPEVHATKDCLQFGTALIG